jgi:hypothetical protein
LAPLSSCAARQLNLLRLMFNTLAPGVNVGGPEGHSIRKVTDSRIKPELFNAEGQKYQKHQIKTDCSLALGASPSYWRCGFHLILWRRALRRATERILNE